jgi:hypothetical protein
MRAWRVAIVIMAVFVPSTVIFAMSSTNYGIDWDSANSGGEDTSSSTNFRLRDTVGEMGTGLSGSSNYQINAGYRTADMQELYLALTVGTQQNNTKVAWTAFSNAGKTVDVASAASFSTGTYIGVVENAGLSQLVAFGKITSIAGLTITVDAWDGEPGSLSASPSAGDDFVYGLNGTQASLDTQVAGQGTTALTLLDVVSNSEVGYTVTVQSDGYLRATSTTFIADVTDGAVTAGFEEYGGEAVGTFATSTGTDFSFASTTARDVQKSTASSSHNRSGIIYKLAITPATPSGLFSQVLYYRLTPNY